MSFKIGDHVRLNPTYARAVMGNRKQVVRKGQASFDWTTRCGVVAWLSADRSSVGVRWEGRTSIEQYALRALELAA